jgi:hypothetical protein
LDAALSELLASGLIAKVNQYEYEVQGAGITIAYSLAEADAIKQTKLNMTATINALEDHANFILYHAMHTDRHIRKEREGSHWKLFVGNRLIASTQRNHEGFKSFELALVELERKGFVKAANKTLLAQFFTIDGEGIAAAYKLPPQGMPPDSLDIGLSLSLLAESLLLQAYESNRHIDYFQSTSGPTKGTKVEKSMRIGGKVLYEQTDIKAYDQYQRAMNELKLKNFIQPADSLDIFNLTQSGVGQAQILKQNQKN